VPEPAGFCLLSGEGEVVETTFPTQEEDLVAQRVRRVEKPLGAGLQVQVVLGPTPVRCQEPVARVGPEAANSSSRPQSISRKLCIGQYFGPHMEQNSAVLK